ncbi:lipopolysaccharide biosynthesis protein [Bhargavaea beijingensis]|uniref:Membrane protein involved in the export of O-antigen and teichoic acid n=1 Tax=Bhargavaea beijingensis TaxID=426756 RepID=A0ABX9ZDI4_9BACL|nr:hypothetical protein [Bhargavaea beijingensis]RSK33698.1 hypothetical protein EJA12_06010 [Bhargavaea beijingensis]
MKKVAKNIGASFLNQMVNIITNFILPPLIIGTYGSQVNGLVTTIKQLMSYIRLVGAGISIATNHSLYKPLADKDYHRTSGMLNAANSMFNKAGTLFTVLALITSFIYPTFIKGTLDYTLVVILIIVMSIEGASEFFVVGKYKSLLYADQKSYITSLVQTFGIVLSFIFTYILILQQANIVLVLLAASLLYVVRIVFLTTYVRRNYSYLNPKTPPIMSAVEKRNDAFIHQLTGLAILSSQAIVLSIFVGLEAASLYAVYNVVFSGLYSICSQVVSSVAPFLGRTKALDNNIKLRKQFNLVEFSYNLVMSYIYSVCTIMIIPFITIYVGNADINYIDYGVASLFLLFSFFNTIRLPAQYMISVAGHFKETKIKAVIEASISIVLQVVLVNFYGIYGVLIGTAIAIGWRCFDIILYTNKYIISQANKLSLIRMVKIPVVTLILIIINYAFINNEVTTFREWFLLALINSFYSIMTIVLVNIIIERKMFFKTFNFLLKKVF